MTTDRGRAPLGAAWRACCDRRFAVPLLRVRWVAPSLCPWFAAHGHEHESATSISCERSGLTVGSSPAVPDPTRDARWAGTGRLPRVQRVARSVSERSAVRQFERGRCSSNLGDGCGRHFLREHDAGFLPTQTSWLCGGFRGYRSYLSGMDFFRSGFGKMGSLFSRLSRSTRGSKPEGLPARMAARSGAAPF